MHAATAEMTAAGKPTATEPATSAAAEPATAKPAMSAAAEPAPTKPAMSAAAKPAATTRENGRRDRQRRRKCRRDEACEKPVVHRKSSLPCGGHDAALGGSGEENAQSPSTYKCARF
jgi:hypothetical protein